MCFRSHQAKSKSIHDDRFRFRLAPDPNIGRRGNPHQNHRYAAQLKTVNGLLFSADELKKPEGRDKTVFKFIMLSSLHLL